MQVSLSPPPDRHVPETVAASLLLHCVVIVLALAAPRARLTDVEDPVAVALTFEPDTPTPTAESRQVSPPAPATMARADVAPPAAMEPPRRLRADVTPPDDFKPLAAPPPKAPPPQARAKPPPPQPPASARPSFAPLAQPANPASALSPPASSGRPTAIRPGLLDPGAKPPYPASALRRGEQGVVRLAYACTVEGRVAEISVLRSSQSATLDSAAANFLASRACAKAAGRFSIDYAFDLPGE